MSDSHTEDESYYEEEERNNNSVKMEQRTAERGTKPTQAETEESNSEASEELEDGEDEELEEEDHAEEQNRAENQHEQDDLENSIDEVTTPQPKLPATERMPSQTFAAPAKKQSRKPPNHPTYELMVNQALTDLNERVGSSLPAIKKYLMSNFSLSENSRIGFFILKYIKKALTEGKLKQTKNKYKLLKNKTKNPKATKVAKAKPKPVPTKKTSVQKTTAPLAKKGAQKDMAPSTSKKAAPSKKTVAKSTEKPKKAATSKQTASAKNVAAKSTKATAKKTTAAAADSQPAKVTRKKQVAKPTLKIAASTSRKSLSLVKKKPSGRKAAETSKNAAAEKEPIEKRATRAGRSASKK